MAKKGPPISDYDVYLEKLSEIYEEKTEELLVALENVNIRVDYDELEEKFKNLGTRLFAEEEATESLTKLKEEFQKQMSLACVLHMMKNSTVCKEVEQI